MWDFLASALHNAVVLLCTATTNTTAARRITGPNCFLQIAVARLPSVLVPLKYLCSPFRSSPTNTRQFGDSIWRGRPPHQEFRKAECLSPGAVWLNLAFKAQLDSDETQVRSANVGRQDDLDDSVAFLLPFLLHPKRIKVQVFVTGDKTRHNLLCKEIHLKDTIFIKKLHVCYKTCRSATCFIANI